LGGTASSAGTPETGEPGAVVESAAEFAAGLASGFAADGLESGADGTPFIRDTSPPSVREMAETVDFALLPTAEKEQELKEISDNSNIKRGRRYKRGV